MFACLFGKRGNESVPYIFPTNSVIKLRSLLAIAAWQDRDGTEKNVRKLLH